MARTKLNSKKKSRKILSLPSTFEYLGKETKDTAEHVNMNKRACVNKDFVHSGSGPVYKEVGDPR